MIGARVATLVVTGAVGAAVVMAAAPSAPVTIESVGAHLPTGRPQDARFLPVSPAPTTTTTTTVPTQFSLQQIEGVLNTMSVNFNIDHCLIWAMAWYESKWDSQAVGDHGTSFGLFQLHLGGELGNLTPQEVMDEPALDAYIAVGQLANVIRSHPGISPGWAAALAQRPANATVYAANINYWWNACHTGWNPAAQ